MASIWSSTHGDKLKLVASRSSDKILVEAKVIEWNDGQFTIKSMSSTTLTLTDDEARDLIEQLTAVLITRRSKPESELQRNFNNYKKTKTYHEYA
jgi:curli biogenesis system outer membrane secretion channel CsgG